MAAVAAAGEGRQVKTVCEMACFLSFPNRRWTSSCDRACRRRGGASTSVHRQSVCFSAVNRDRYPQQFQFRLCNGRVRCLWEQHIDKVVDVPVVVQRPVPLQGCSMEAFE